MVSLLKNLFKYRQYKHSKWKEMFISLMTQSFLNNIIIDWSIGCQKGKSILLEVFAWLQILVLTQQRQADVIKYLKTFLPLAWNGVIIKDMPASTLFSCHFYLSVYLTYAFIALQFLHSVTLMELNLLILFLRKILYRFHLLSGSIMYTVLSFPLLSIDF